MFIADKLAAVSRGGVARLSVLSWFWGALWSFWGTGGCSGDVFGWFGVFWGDGCSLLGVSGVLCAGFGVLVPFWVFWGGFGVLWGVMGCWVMLSGCFGPILVVFWGWFGVFWAILGCFGAVLGLV